jgi:hypothetical protein
VPEASTAEEEASPTNEWAAAEAALRSDAAAAAERCAPTNARSAVEEWIPSAAAEWADCSNGPEAARARHPAREAAV